MNHTQAKTPQNMSMAAHNAILEIRSWQSEHQQAMADQDQLRIIMDHLSDFIKGRAFVSEYRKDTLRAFVNFLCPDEECLEALQDALDQRKAA